MKKKKVRIWTVKEIDSKLWTPPYGDSKLIEDNPFYKERFVLFKDYKK